MDALEPRTIKIHKLLDELSTYLLDKEAHARRETKERGQLALHRLQVEFQTREDTDKQCPNCKTAVAKSGFDEHKRQCRKIKHPSQVETFETQAPDETKMNNTSGHEYKVDSEYTRERRLDETREHGHGYREGNLYGSPVSHDDFDDESTPG